MNAKERALLRECEKELDTWRWEISSLPRGGDDYRRITDLLERIREALAKKGKRK